MTAAEAWHTHAEPRLTPTEMAKLCHDAERQDRSRGAVLMLEGSASDHVLVIGHGVVKITAATADGDIKLLAFRGRGQLVGDFGCIDGAPRSGTVVALVTVVVWRIPAKRFETLLRGDPALCFSVLKLTVARVRESDAKLGEFGGLSAADRVVRLLGRLALNCFDAESGTGGIAGGGVSVPVDQSELAASAGVSRETVSRTITSLAAAGIAHTRRGRVVVTDLPALLNETR